MREETEQYDVDQIRYQHAEWDAKLFREGHGPVIQSHVRAHRINVDCPVTVEFDEYFTYIEGDLLVTVSYIVDEYEGEEYKDEYEIEEVEAR